MAYLGVQPWMRRDGLSTILSAFDAVGPDCIRFVGGCVRDSLLGGSIGDVDLAVRCPPDRLMETLSAQSGLRLHPVGLEHGVVVVAVGGHSYEIASLRKDVRTDGRHARIASTESWSQDAQRRDFRCNALYANADGHVFDPTGGGLDDIRAGKVVFIGNADRRIREDYLRILRFFRFSARYARQIDPAGLAACARLRGGLERISAERIWAELKAVLVSRRADLAVQAMTDSSVLEQILGPHASGDTFAAMVRIDRTTGLDPDAVLRLVALMPVDADFSALAAALRMSSQEKKTLIAAGSAFQTATIDSASLSRLAYRDGADTVRSQLRLYWASTPRVTPDMSLLEHVNNWQCPRFPLGGQDAIDAGVSGAEIGTTLRRIEDEWVALDFLPTPDQLVQRLSVLVRSGQQGTS